MVETKWDSAWKLPPTASNSEHSEVIVGFQPLSQMSAPVFPNIYLHIVLQSITYAKFIFENYSLQGKKLCSLKNKAR